MLSTRHSGVGCELQALRAVWPLQPCTWWESRSPELDAGCARLCQMLSGKMVGVMSSQLLQQGRYLGNLLHLLFLENSALANPLNTKTAGCLGKVPELTQHLASASIKLYTVTAFGHELLNLCWLPILEHRHAAS